ncbi:hypothetical protein NQ314_014140 [Rhamnusium bicolor]|uniref:Uncharacterized protein n=1 Tax=Rhamnusium bicolor TaxID=1586634 RepID=A0AAV8X3B0_9CUCU|nr:hypothetical protein NQ314_014140 [Rhamnusium bicolor]
MIMVSCVEEPKKKSVLSDTSSERDNNEEALTMDSDGAYGMETFSDLENHQDENYETFGIDVPVSRKCGDYVLVNLTTEKITLQK